MDDKIRRLGDELEKLAEHSPEDAKYVARRLDKALPVPHECPEPATRLTSETKFAVASALFSYLNWAAAFFYVTTPAGERFCMGNAVLVGIVAIFATVNASPTFTKKVPIHCTHCKKRGHR